MMNLFGKKPVHDPAIVQQLKAWTREILQLAEETTITVAQLNCAEEDCPDVETVIGVLEPGKQRKFKVFKPLIEVMREDLTTALAREPS